VSWTRRICSRYLDPVTTTPPEGPKYSRNENWRSWNVTKNRVIRISEEDWTNFGAICNEEGTDRTADLRAHIQQRIRLYRRKHPGVMLPGDPPNG
jgi:hypothetical protein